MRQMREGEQLTSLIGAIYDAALDSGLWTDVLAKIAGFVGGQAGGLALKDSASHFVSAYYYTGLDPCTMQLYADTYSEFDPHIAMPLFDVGQIVTIPEIMPYDDYLQGRFYREWGGPQGWVDFAAAVLEKSVTSCSFVSIIRHETSGMVDNEMRRRMKLVVPHVRRSVLIGKVIELKQTEAATFADTLDGLNSGLFLIDATGRVVHANTAGHSMLRQNSFLNLIGGRLVASDAHVNETLRDIFIANRGDSEIGIKGIALPLTARSGERYVAHVLPLTSGTRRRAGIAYRATAALFVHNAALESPSAPEVIGKTYNLTPAELRVLLAIVDVGGIPEVAVSLGVAETTVRTHVTHLFEKMGAGRQADLVKLVAGFSTPLANRVS